MSAISVKKVKKNTDTKAAPAEKPKIAHGKAETLVLRPRLSEKAYALSEQHNTYVFDVPALVNRFDIANAVSGQYGVNVASVRLAGIPGKAVRSYRNRGRRSISSKRSDLRKAYVTLKKGDKLPIFAAIEESQKPEETK